MEKSTTLAPSSTKHLERTKTALMEMALKRGAKPTAEALKVYSRRLQESRIEDIEAALDLLGEQHREEGELAFPDLATVLRSVSAAKLARERRISAAAERVLMAFKCPDCGREEAGWFAPRYDEPRTCRGFGRVQGTICGAILDCVARG